MNKLKIAALLAIAGTGLAASAQAVTYSGGDVLIGFRSTNAGITKDYIIDIGQQLFTQAANNGGTVTIGTFGADLATFDANWFTDGTTRWGVAGISLSGVDTSNIIYVGTAESATQHPWTTSALTTNYKGSAGNSTTVGKINNVGSVLTGGTANSGDSTSGDTSGGSFPIVGVQLQTASVANSWANAVTVSGGAFARFPLSSTTGSFDATVGTGGFSDSIDFIRLTTSSGAAGLYEGTFSINSAGTITFSTPVPEPSTFTALAGGLGLLGFLRRRRAVVA